MLYCLPSAVLLSLLASAAREDNRDWLLECLAQLTGADVSSPELLSSFRAQAYVYYKLLAMGSQAACCSVLLHNVYKHYQHLSQKNEWFCRVLIGFSAVAIFYYQSDQVYKLTIVASLIMTIYATIDEKKPMSIVQRGLLQDLKRLSRFFGNLSIYLYLLLLGALWVLSSVFPHPLLCIAWDYFFIGSLVFGSGHSVFTALYLHTVINGAVDADLFWLGLPVMMLIPGPPSNFVIFLGFLMDRGVGALVAWLCFYLPCILSIYGFLPNWHRVRNLAALQRFCIGMRCFNLGVTLTTVPIVLLEAGKADLVLMLMIFMVTFVLSYAYERNYAAVIFLGALLANLRRWAVLYYREADYSFAI
jgi:chromate transport protein ChrA